MSSAGDLQGKSWRSLAKRVWADVGNNLLTGRAEVSSDKSNKTEKKENYGNKKNDKEKVYGYRK